LQFIYIKKVKKVFEIFKIVFIIISILEYYNQNIFCIKIDILNCKIYLINLIKIRDNILLYLLIINLKNLKFTKIYIIKSFILLY